ncbi:MAG: hypothetical protein AAFO07_33340, partial [Bacteroidota bacterium]
GDYEFQVYLTDETTGCESELSDPFMVTIHPLPATPTITGEDEECEGMNAMLNVDVPDGTFATWVAVIDGPDGSGVFADDEYEPEFENGGVRVRTDFGENGEQLRVRDNAPVGDYEFQVYLTDETTGCESELSDPFMVTIHPLPQGTIEVSSPICQGDESILSLNLTVGTYPVSVLITGLNENDPINFADANATYTITSDEYNEATTVPVSTDYTL